MAKYKPKFGFDPNHLPAFKLPASFIKNCKEFSNNSNFMYFYFDENNEFKVNCNFNSQSDFFAMVTQAQIHCGTNLGYSSQMLSENIIDEIDGGSGEWSEEDE